MAKVADALELAAWGNRATVFDLTLNKVGKEWNAAHAASRVFPRAASGSMMMDSARRYNQPGEGLILEDCGYRVHFRCTRRWPKYIVHGNDVTA